jgi:hypothetical protein
MVLGGYVTPSADSALDTARAIACLQRRFLAYFGKSTLLQIPDVRWVLLGENDVWRGPVSPQGFTESRYWPDGTSPNVELLSAWQKIVHIVSSDPGFGPLRDRAIFLNVLQTNADRPDWPRGFPLQVQEGDTLDFEVHYCIPDFQQYDGVEQLKPSSVASH